MSSGPRRYELNDCDREPIHALNFIQPFAALLAVNTDWHVVHYSANAAAILSGSDGVEPPRIEQGTSLRTILRPAVIDRIREALADLAGENAVERLFGLELVDGALFDCAIHRQAELVLIEFEPSPDHPAPGKQLDIIRPLTQQLESTPDIDRLCRLAAEKLKAILGYDRVMVYRFAEDGTGEVIAEQREPHLESFFGLRYPRTDIPEQARELYLRNHFRIIADVAAEPVAILPKPRFGSQPLDLSLSISRAVSPIHIQYLKNMGVGASLSISIVHQGKLWGLFACHHSSGKPLPFAVRTSWELFSQLFSLALDRALMRVAEATRTQGQKLHDQLMVRLAEGRTLIENLPLLDDMLREIIPHDGLSILAEESYRARGAAPNEEEFKAIQPALNGAPGGKLIATVSLAKHVSAARAFADRAAGALIIPISRNPRDYLVLWRRELPQKVVWGGNPDKALGKRKPGEPLTPRSSFAAWEEAVTDQSEPWSEQELQIAESLRTTLIEVVLRLTDEAERDRRKAQEQQALLIAELNHRVRNILNLIRSLIDQSRHEALDVNQFVDIIGGRIAALASAHENITRENWSPAPVSKLIEAEAKAYLNDKRERLQLKGEDVLVTPEAYTVLALVMHEMVTNSAKYGCLCDRSGELEITLGRTFDDDLVIDWIERGGPPVKEPSRRGFGSTIIERSIPFELKGESRIDYKREGVEARFRIPARYIREPEVQMPLARNQEQDASAQGDMPNAARPSHILLVEDSMIIALDTAETLRHLGIEDVTTSSSSASALDAIDRVRPDFAIVDYNLGSETSETVIEELRHRGIPFLLATGYGNISAQAQELGAAGIIRKPYGRMELEASVPGLGQSDEIR